MNTLHAQPPVARSRTYNNMPDSQGPWLMGNFLRPSSSYK